MHDVVLETARSLALGTRQGAPGAISAGLAELALAALDEAARQDLDLVQRLRVAARRQAAARMVAENEVKSVLELLSRARIRSVPWKGCAIATRWSRREWRPVGDLDLLLRGADMGSAISLLCAHGYRVAPEERGGRFRPGPTGIELLPPSDRTLVVDVHARPFRSVGHRIDVTGLFERAEPIELLGVPTLRLSHVDEAHLTFVHAAKHGCTATKWRLDVAVVAGGLDEQAWDSVALAARAARTERPVALALDSVGDPNRSRFHLPRWIARLLDVSSNDSTTRRYLREILLEPGLRARGRMVLGLTERLMRREKAPLKA